MISYESESELVLFKSYNLDRPSSRDPNIVSKHVLSNFSRQELMKLNEKAFPLIEDKIKEIVK